MTTRHQPLRTAAPVLAMLVGLVAVDANGSVPILPLHTGDIDNDGLRNVTDINCYISAVLTGSPDGSSPPCQAFADDDVDLQCDGALDIVDVQRVILVVLYVATSSDSLAELLQQNDANLDLLHDDCEGAGVEPCAPIGASNPANPCEVCGSGTDPPAWVPLSGVPCDDGDACTLDDTCIEGACAGGEIPDCDDANICTTDSCDPDWGCLNVNNNAPCDDGDFCTLDDTCGGGFCCGAIDNPDCASGPPPLCCVEGSAGEQVECPIRLARATATTPAPATLQFTLFVDSCKTTSLGMVKFVDHLVLPGAIVVEVDTPPGTLFPTGHTVAVMPTPVATWSNSGAVAILHSAEPAPSITDATFDGGTLVGDPTVMRLLINLYQDIPPGSANACIDVDDVLAWSSSGEPMLGFTADAPDLEGAIGVITVYGEGSP